MMQQAVDRVWGEVGENMAEMGITQGHLWARMIEAAQRKAQHEMQGRGDLPPKFFELSKTQQVMFLREMNR